MSITDSLHKVLANTYLLYLKTQNYHWNVTGGPYFVTLHKLFEENYEELADAVDDIAERIRQLGTPVSATFADFAKVAQLKEGSATKDARDMLVELAADQEAMLSILQQAWKVADAAEDEVSADLLIERMDAHSKAAWFYRSSIG